MDGQLVEIRFSARPWYWRGPAPFHFVTIPEAGSADIASVARAVTYGWGMIPVRAEVGGTSWETALFAKDGGYVLPLRKSVREAEDIDLDVAVDVCLVLDA